MFFRLILQLQALNQMMSCGQGAYRVGRARITGQQEGLAAAAAEVYRATLATATRLHHPLLSSEALKSC
jgi:hypothetical protein